MLKLKINGTKYHLLNEFHEVNMKALRDVYAFLEGLDIDITEYFKDKEKNKVSASKLLDFKIKFLSFFTNIEEDVLKNVRVEGAQDLSIEFLFSHVEKFIYQPQQYAQVKEFTLNGKKYELVKDTETISGAHILFGEGNYNQWKLSNMLSAQIQKGINVNTADSLVQMLAVLYVNDNDNSDKAIEGRIKEFWQMDGFTAWSCYFFFAKLLDKWRDFFHSYTGKTTSRKLVKAHKMTVKEQLLRLLSKVTFGQSLKLKWLNYRYLITDWTV